MVELRRLGDLVDFDTEFRTGDRRIIHGYSALSDSILFADEKFGIKDFYISSSPEKRVTIPSLKREIEIGDYEGSILDKLLNPTKPVMCIQGRMGSGKTTTLRYLVDNYLNSDNDTDVIKPVLCKRVIVWVDFRQMVTEEKPTIHDVDEILCTQLWNKVHSQVNEEDEYGRFWEYMFALNNEGRDRFVESVVGAIMVECPEVQKRKDVNQEMIDQRKEIKRLIRSKNILWYLKYLVLLYRFLIREKFLDNRGCAIIILDNVDSLSTELQRELVNIIIGCAHAQGPTFVILVRPETFDRNGLNDIMPDVIEHHNPEPCDVLIDRIHRFLLQPEKYLQVAGSLSVNERELLISYLQKIYPRLKRSVFVDFVRDVSGKNIRNTLALGKGIFQLTIGEMKHKDVTPQYIIRSMIRLGPHQYRFSRNPRLANPFDVEGITDGRYLMKIRLLNYIVGHGGLCKTPSIIRTFSMFNSSDLESDHRVVTDALGELLRNECQLITSNGFDAYHITPDDDQDEISITEIGIGYITHLIYNIHFIQEVMLDSRVPTILHVRPYYQDTLVRKIGVMVNFLRDVYHSDVDEVNTFIIKGVANYAATFQPRLITFDIIHRAYEHTKEMLDSMKAKKRKEIVQEYEDILVEFQSLVNDVTARNNQIFGVLGQIRPETE
jgi:hypothetical protein